VKPFTILASTSVCCTLELDQYRLWEAEGLTLLWRRRGMRVSGSREAMLNLASHARARGTGGWDLSPSSIRACIGFAEKIEAMIRAAGEPLEGLPGEGG
jgi:hypothetical protein